MKLIILLFKPHRAWLSRCLSFFLLLSGLLLSGQVRAQLYTGGNSSLPAALSYYDLTTNTWTTKASAPTSTVYGVTVFQGKIYTFASSKIGIYDPATNTWTTVNNTSLTAGNYFAETVGNYIYLASQTAFVKYDPATNTATTVSTLSATEFGQLVYDGGDYIYMGSILGTYNKRFSISGNSWAALSTAPHTTDGVAYANGKLYLCAQQVAKFSSYDPATNSYTTLATPPFNLRTLVKGDGNYIYGGTYTGLARYDISTNTWTTLTGTVNLRLLYIGATCAPTASATAIQATCTSAGGVNTNAALTLSAYGGGVTKVGYSVGSSYTGPAFSAATAVTTAPMTLVNNLANPTVPQPYTIRAFQDATCYKDVVVTLMPTVCLTSDLSLTLSPVAQTGAKGELLTYTFTLTNAGPDVATGVQVDIKVPTNATLLTASPQLGTYSETTLKWDISSMPVGSQTLTVTLKMN